MQRDPQLIREKVNEFKRGENPDKSRIGYYRSPAYRSFKRTLNPLASGTVDLILTGQFTRGLFVDKRGNGRFLFDSTDDKTDDLIGKYGLDIMGINQETWLKLQRTTHNVELVKFMKRELRQ